MRNTIRGQSSTEYLLTYAWALILAGALIAFIYYLGGFNVLSAPSYTATGFTNLEMYTFQAFSNGTVVLNVRNQVENPITIKNVTVDGALVPSNLPKNVSSGSLVNITLTKTFGPAYNQYTKRLKFAFILQGSNITHYESGQISDKVYPS